ncbi:MAG: 1-acyl-sn-glycerol-3-phosphate acyltransferase [Treponema sp.]|jgi:1-acyl-sn-glycerol-3-phosphate acyltransferase|nr:1-acyl-sn-glycerol-3-phosphate acyltransferase [Treponema sp.]
MINFITVSCFFVTLSWPALLNIIAYPISLKLSSKVSDYIVKVCAPRVFSIMKTYKHFDFRGDRASKKLLPPQFLLLSNHQSLLDIPAYMNFMRNVDLRFVAKDELSRHVPVVSEMLRAHQHCMIPRRGSASAAMKIIEEFGRRVLAKNEIPVLFPEGTRSKDGSLGKFYAAGFRRLSETVHLPVAVCALDGGYRINNLGKIMTRMKNGTYYIKVLKIFPAPDGKAAQMAVLNEAHDLIQQQLEEWRAGSK